MRLTFESTELMKLVADAMEAWKGGCNPTYGQEEPIQPGFWIVGDQGVYLMHNGKRPEGVKPMVVYAKECNPEIQPFDEWWSVKGATFGGDDGCEYLEARPFLDAALQGDDIKIGFTPDSMTVVAVAGGAKA